MSNNDKVIELLDRWMKDESGYDEKNWPVIKQTIEDNRSSYRKRFNNCVEGVKSAVR